MEANKKRKLKSGTQYDSIIPQPDGATKTLSSSISVAHTVRSMKQIVEQYKQQLAHLAPQLKGNTLRDTLSNIWHFVYQHIQYHRDTPGKEELHTPARIWAKRTHGVDCDDYSIFQSAILSLLGIPHMFRVTKYSRDWQHVYVIVPDQSHPRGYWTLDPVTDSFDYEVPYTDKQDHEMSTVLLSGLGDSPNYEQVGFLPTLPFLSRFSNRKRQPQQVGELGIKKDSRTPEQIAEQRRKGILASAKQQLEYLERNNFIASEQAKVNLYEQVVARLKAQGRPDVAARYEPSLNRHRQRLANAIAHRKRLEAIIAANGNIDFNGNRVGELGFIRRSPAKQAALAAKQQARQAARANGASRREARQAGRAAAQAVRAGQPATDTASRPATTSRRQARQAARIAKRQARAAGATRRQARQVAKATKQAVRSGQTPPSATSFPQGQTRRQRRQANKELRMSRRQKRQAAKQQRRQTNLEARQKRRDTRRNARLNRRNMSNPQQAQEPKDLPIMPASASAPAPSSPDIPDSMPASPSASAPSSPDIPDSMPSSPSASAPAPELPAVEPEWNDWSEESSLPTMPTMKSGGGSAESSFAPMLNEEGFPEESDWDENWDEGFPEESDWSDEEFYEEEMEGIHGFEWNWDEANEQFFIGNTPATPATPARVRSRRMNRGIIKRLQRALQAHGLQVTVNGQMDAQTNAALLQAEQRGLIKLQSREPVVIAPTELRRFVQASRAVVRQQRKSTKGSRRSGGKRGNRSRQATTPTPAPTPVPVVPTPAPTATPTFVVDSRNLPVPATPTPESTPALRTGRSESDVIDVDAQDVTPVTTSRNTTPATTQPRTGIVQRITDTVRRRPVIAIGAAALVVGGLYAMSRYKNKSVNGLEGVKRKRKNKNTGKRLGGLGETFGNYPLR
jgi:hypothetical protein